MGRRRCRDQATGPDAGHCFPPEERCGSSTGGADRARLRRVTAVDAALCADARAQRVRRRHIRLPGPWPQPGADARQPCRPGRKPAHVDGLDGGDGRLGPWPSGRRRALCGARAFDGLGHHRAPRPGRPCGAGQRRRFALCPEHRGRHAGRQPAQPARHRRRARAADDGHRSTACGRPCIGRRGSGKGLRVAIRLRVVLYSQTAPQGRRNRPDLFGQAR